MASFTTNTTNSSSSNVSTNLFGRELSIASSFVKQYYTLLNKAPCYIHNFYSHDSTFIHGTLEMANEHYTEPVIGRESIKRKMEDLKLNDCRAKIKQIDSLETLGGGLVIQVIGELSNNGKPMRRFLQTFVLAPSPDESRQEGDRAGAADRRETNMGHENSSSHNQKFFVLNSIFRYQDDGQDSEFEEDMVSIHANTSAEGTNGGSETMKMDTTPKSSHANMHIGNGPSSDHPQNRRRPIEGAVRSVDDVERLANELDEGIKLNKPAMDGEYKRDIGAQKTSNGTGIIDKKNEASDKSTENGKTAVDNSQVVASSSSTATVQPVASTASRPLPSNEPKTWANMVRNAHPTSASIQMNVNKNIVEQQQPQQQQPPQQQTHQSNINQTSSGQAHQHQPQQQQNQQQQQPQQQQSSQNNNNRRRHMVRKPSNKSTGRPLKNRPRQPASKPVA